MQLTEERHAPQHIHKPDYLYVMHILFLCGSYVMNNAANLESRLRLLAGQPKK